MSAFLRRALFVLTCVSVVICFAPQPSSPTWTLPAVTVLSARVDGSAADVLDAATTLERVPTSQLAARRLRLDPQSSRRSVATSRPRGPRPGFSPRPGERVFRLSIPSIGVREWVVQGTDASQLAGGPGHYPDCGPDFSLPFCSRYEEVWPGERGRVIVGGHRTLATRPFFDLGEVRRGDRVVIRSAWGNFVYVVRERALVAATDNSVIDPDVRQRELVLVACHPKYSSAQRLLVFAELQTN